MFEKILALYDLSDPSKAALEWSIRFGERFHSELKVIHLLIREEGAEMSRRIRDEIDKTVRTLTARGGEGRLNKLEINVSAGKTVPSLLGIIEKESPDLVVLGTHGRTGLDYVLLGSVAEKIARHSPSPVLTVRRSSVWPPKTLLVPVDFADGGEASEEALLLATQFCQSIPVRVELVHILSMPDLVTGFPESMAGRAPIDQEKMEKFAMGKLGEIIAMHPSLKMFPRVSIGPIADEICRIAKEARADVILIPTHGRSALGRLLLGSVAEHVIRYAPCHVLSFCPKKGIGHRRKAIQDLENDYIDLGVGD
jgi:nucleotide-binding universal stress UspA family protein